MAAQAAEGPSTWRPSRMHAGIRFLGVCIGEEAAGLRLVEQEMADGTWRICSNWVKRALGEIRALGRPLTSAAFWIRRNGAKGKNWATNPGLFLLF